MEFRSGNIVYRSAVVLGRKAGILSFQSHSPNLKGLHENVSQVLEKAREAKGMVPGFILVRNISGDGIQSAALVAKLSHYVRVFAWQRHTGDGYVVVRGRDHYSELQPDYLIPEADVVLDD